MNKLVIEKELLKHNVEKIKAFAGTTPVMGIVKCNGYGLGLVEYSKLILEYGIDLLGVSCYEEALMLKDSGINCEVVLLTSYADEDVLKEVVKRDIIATVGSTASAKALENAGVALSKTPRANIEIDTGMGRIGCFPDEAAPLAKEITDQNILKLAGTITHFAVSDSITTENQEFTKKQYNDFVQAIENIKKEGINPGIKTCSSSAALFAFPEMQMDMVRPGIVIYGYYPDEITKDFLKNKGIDIDLKPVMQLETSVVAIKKITKGTSISYGRTWIAQNDTTIAVLPIGYADGLLRRNSPGLKVTINGKLYPICGRICMDQCMVDLGLNNTEVKRWDKVIIYGPKDNEALQDANDIATMTNTIPYEIMTSICAKRVQKYFI